MPSKCLFTKIMYTDCISVGFFTHLFIEIKHFLKWSILLAFEILFILHFGSKYTGANLFLGKKSMLEKALCLDKNMYLMHIQGQTVFTW